MSIYCRWKTKQLPITRLRLLMQKNQTYPVSLAHWCCEWPTCSKPRCHLWSWAARQTHRPCLASDYQWPCHWCGTSDSSTSCSSHDNEPHSAWTQTEQNKGSISWEQRRQLHWNYQMWNVSGFKLSNPFRIS